MNPDVALFHLINNLAGNWPPADWIARLLVNDFLVPTLASLAAVWLWFAGETPEEHQRNRRTVVFLVLAVVLAQAFIKGISLVYFRPRPFASETVKLLFYRPSVSSFPSVPIAAVFSFAMGAWYADKRVGKALAILGALYGFARVYAGVHYPLDIVGGAIIGAGASWLVARYSRLLNPLADTLINLMQRLVFV